MTTDSYAFNGAHPMSVFIDNLILVPIIARDPPILVCNNECILILHSKYYVMIEFHALNDLAIGIVDSQLVIKEDKQFIVDLIIVEDKACLVVFVDFQRLDHIRHITSTLHVSN